MIHFATLALVALPGPLCAPADERVDAWIERAAAGESFIAKYDLSVGADAPLGVRLIYHSPGRAALEMLSPDGAVGARFVNDGWQLRFFDAFNQLTSGSVDVEAVAGDRFAWFDGLRAAFPADGGTGPMRTPVTQFTVIPRPELGDLVPQLTMQLGHLPGHHARQPLGWLKAIADSGVDLEPIEGGFGAEILGGLSIELEPERGMLRRAWVDAGAESDVSLELVSIEYGVELTWEQFADWTPPATEDDRSVALGAEYADSAWKAAREDGLAWLVQRVADGLALEDGTRDAIRAEFRALHAMKLDAFTTVLRDQARVQADALIDQLSQWCGEHRDQPGFDTAFDRSLATTRGAARAWIEKQERDYRQAFLTTAAASDRGETRATLLALEAEAIDTIFDESVAPTILSRVDERAPALR